MENAVDALKIAFAVFVFVIALSMTLMLVSEAKATSDTILYYSDETNFYHNLNSSTSNRVVGLSEVISMLYRCFTESICVTVDLGSGNVTEFNPATGDYANRKAFEDKLATYIENNLLRYEGAEFTEEFVEVPVTGIYSTGSDGTEIVIENGTKRIYVTYKLQQP